VGEGVLRKFSEELVYNVCRFGDLKESMKEIGSDAYTPQLQL
jgi:hypothetical protein